MSKIVFIGGGSYNWMPTILSVLLSSKRLAGSELVLMDIDNEALHLIKAFSEKFLKKAKTSYTVSSTTSLEEALRGANYVVVTIAVGGLDAMRVDLEIPEKYGIWQTVGDTVGPGGFSRALRHIPVMVDIALKMEKHCPSAWMLNLTNPLSVLTLTVNRETSIRAVGLCHGVKGQVKMYASLLGENDPENVVFTTTGIDHCSWLTQFSINGKNGFELLKERGFHRADGNFPHKAETLDFFAGAEGNQAVFALWKELGYLPAISDRHIVEFFPDFLTNKALMKKYQICRTSIEQRRKGKEFARQKIENWISGKEQTAIGKTNDIVVELIEALEGKRKLYDVLNFPNIGQIPNLPQESVVETFCQVDSSGIHPVCAGEIPPLLDAIVRPHILRQEMSIDASLKSSLDLAVSILATDPLIKTITDARSMLNEMIKANIEYLPVYKEQDRSVDENN